MWIHFFFGHLKPEQVGKQNSEFEIRNSNSFPRISSEKMEALFYNPFVAFFIKSNLKQLVLYLLSEEYMGANWLWFWVISILTSTVPICHQDDVLVFSVVVFMPWISCPAYTGNAENHDLGNFVLNVGIGHDISGSGAGEGKKVGCYTPEPLLCTLSLSYTSSSVSGKLRM